MLKSCVTNGKAASVGFRSAHSYAPTAAADLRISTSPKSFYRYQTFVGVGAWSVVSWLQYSSGDTLKVGRWEHGLLSVIGCRPVFYSGSI
jgi:hypothetical protein